jgi:hypothetical protein
VKVRRTRFARRDQAEVRMSSEAIHFWTIFSPRSILTL